MSHLSKSFHDFYVILYEGNEKILIEIPLCKHPNSDENLNSSQLLLTTPPHNSSFVSVVGELNNAVLLSDLTSMDSSTKQASAQLNKSMILEETEGKSLDQSDFYVLTFAATNSKPGRGKSGGCLF